MKRTKITIDGFRILSEEFNSFNDLLRTCDGREDTGYYGNVRDEYNSDALVTYQQARELLVHGWDEHLKEIVSKFSKYTKGVKRLKNVPQPSVTGYAPIVPNAIRGLPKSMFGDKREYKKDKVITLTVDAGVKWSISAQEVVRRSVEVLSKVYSLEMSGYRVRLNYSKIWYNGKDILIIRVPVKSENQPMDIKRISFPLGHPAMQRCIAWDWENKVPDAPSMGWNRGRSISTFEEWDSEYKVMRKMLGPNEYFIEYNTDLDELLGDLR